MRLASSETPSPLIAILQNSICFNFIHCKFICFPLSSFLQLIFQASNTAFTLLVFPTAYKKNLKFLTLIGLS